MISIIIPSYKDPLLHKTIDSLFENAEGEIEVIAGGYVYLITNKVNGKQYIGQTISNIKQRWSQHIYNAKQGKNYPFYNAINKYGKDNFEISILAKVCSIEGLNFLEQFFINKLKTIVPFGYNLRSGGGNGGKLHKSTRKKISIFHTGKKGISHTKEFKEKLRKRSLNNKYALGRKQSVKEKQKHKVISVGYKRNNKGKFIKKQ